MNGRPARLRFGGRIHGEGQTPGPIDLYLAAHWDGQGVYAAATCTGCGARAMLGIPAGTGEPACPDCGTGRLRFRPAAEEGWRDARPAQRRG